MQTKLCRCDSGLTELGDDTGAVFEKFIFDGVVGAVLYGLEGKSHWSLLLLRGGV